MILRLFQKLGITCPAPVCNSVLDIAIVIDESGSITNNGYWPDVQNFAINLVGALDISNSNIRAGLIFFSGYTCAGTRNGVPVTYYNQTGVNQVTCTCSGSGCTSSNSCPECGGRWQYGTSTLVTAKSTLVNAIKANPGAGGNTCIACGLQEGTKMLNLNPRTDVQKIIILLTDGAQTAVTNGLVRQAKGTLANGIRNIAVGVGGYNLDDLKVFAAEKDIYTVAEFSQLNTLIADLTRSVCQALPPIETCDFCNGICSCQTTCNCPTCDGKKKKKTIFNQNLLTKKKKKRLQSLHC